MVEDLLMDFSEDMTVEISEEYLEFQERYFDDLEAFVLECFEWEDGEGPTDYQLEVLHSITKSRRYALRGPHGLGKTALIAWITHWFTLTRDFLDWKLIITAGSWAQLYDYTWPEIHKWSGRIKWDMVGRSPYNRTELLTTQISLNTGRAFAVNSNRADLIEGAHAQHISYLYDESKAITDPTFDASEGALSNDSGESTPEKEEALAFMVSTPGRPLGRFYQVHKRLPGYEDWDTRHVTREEVIRAGRMNPEWAEQRRKQWGENSSTYQNRVLGEFASSETDSLIALDWIEASESLHREITEMIHSGEIELGDPVSVGCDIADGGNDNTVLSPVYYVYHPVLNYVWYVPRLHTYSNTNVRKNTAKVTKVLRRSKVYREHVPPGGLDWDSLTETQVEKALRDLRGATVGVIDVGGPGGPGVYSSLREEGYRVMKYKGGYKTSWRDHNRIHTFKNLRQAGYWNLRDLFDPEIDGHLALPYDERLREGLLVLSWWEGKDGHTHITKKDDVKKLLKRSPDESDAVMMGLGVHLIKNHTLGLP